jgi:lambda family phage tail tape measure protein
MADDITNLASDSTNADAPGVFDRLQGKTRELEAATNGFGRAITSAFARSITDGRRFEDVLKSLVLRLSDLSLRAALRPLESTFTSGITQLVNGIFGGGGASGVGGGGVGGLLGSLFSGAQAFAGGGVVGTPTLFSLHQGLGVVGEAGAEAVLPLTRGSDGRLGVAASGGSAPASITINIATPDADSFRRSETFVTGMVARAVARGQRGL